MSTAFIELFALLGSGGLLIVMTLADLDPMVPSIIFSVISVKYALRMAQRVHMYSFVALTFHVVMAILVSYFIVEVDHIAQEAEFSFWVMTEANLRIALVTLVSTCLTCVVVWSACTNAVPKRPVAPHSALSALLRALMPLLSIKTRSISILAVASSVCAVALFLTNTSVLDQPYPTNLTTQWAPPFLMISVVAFASGALAIAYGKSALGVRNAGLAPALWLCKLSFVVVIVLMLLLVGGRGYMTFAALPLGALGIYLWRRKREASPLFSIFLIVLVCFMYVSWPYLRASLANEPASNALRTSIRDPIGVHGKSAPGAMVVQPGEIPMLGTSVYHLLYAIDLIERGDSLHGESFYNLGAQFLPSFLDGVVWDRPQNDNWRLAERFSHGGGFLVVANIYWNGGIVAVVLAMGGLCWIFAHFDAHLTAPLVGRFYTIAYFCLFPVYVVQLSYGLQGLVRAIEELAFVWLLEAVVAHSSWGLSRRRLLQGRA